MLYFSIFYENKLRKKVKTIKNSSQLPDKRCSVMDIWALGIYASSVFSSDRGDVKLNDFKKTQTGESDSPSFTYD